MLKRNIAIMAPVRNMNFRGLLLIASLMEVIAFLKSLRKFLNAPLFKRWSLAKKKKRKEKGGV